MIVFLRTAYDYGPQTNITTGTFLDLFRICVPPTLPPPPWQPLNMVWSFHQGWKGGYLHAKTPCANCGKLRGPSGKGFRFVRTGTGRFIRYWCDNCGGYWARYGELRPVEHVKRKRYKWDSLEGRCATCGTKCAAKKHRRWDFRTRHWICIKCYEKTALYQSRRKKKRTLRPGATDACSGCGTKHPSNGRYRKNVFWRWDHLSDEWVCMMCEITTQKVAIRGV